MKEVERQSGGQYRLGPGTLYDNLRKLIQDGLVEDVPLGIESDSKRMYRITANGARLLASEMKTLEEIVRIGRRRLRSLQMA